MRKFRYEIVPGFWSTAIVYAPADLRGKVPAILDVNGHVGAEGKAISYKQKRCINEALQGIMALNLEWLGMGELSSKEDGHGFGGHLDLVGANNVGLFYLEMRRGLDYLYDNPHVDRSRIGVTGLSGGGWQTIVLSSLDTRVKVAVPVAGYEPLAAWLPRYPSAGGDNEQAGTDMFMGQDYATLTAMMAPRPTLLIYNAEDDCCFRAPLEKPYLFDQVRPFFRLYEKEDAFQWHENTDPSTHNYDLDNRQQSYRFFTQYFNLPVTDHEIPVGTQIKNYEELKVGLPPDNLTILGLARKLASEIKRSAITPESSGRVGWVDVQTEKLKEAVRYRPVTVESAYALWNTKDKGVESLSYLFELNNGLPATGTWMKAIEAPNNASITIILNDKGKKWSGVEVSHRVNRDEQVLALDLLFTGDDSTDDIPRPWAYPETLAAYGERPLGMESAQLIALTHWMEEMANTQHARLETSGIRSQVVGLVAAALDHTLFSEVASGDGMRSLGYLLEKPVLYGEAADLFCLDLYRDFDLTLIAAIAKPTTVVNESYVAESPKQ